MTMTMILVIGGKMINKHHSSFPCSIIIVVYLVSSAFVVNYFLTMLALRLYPVTSNNLVYLPIIIYCIIPAFNEEIMRHISVLKGIYTSILFPLTISFLEHYYCYPHESYRSFFDRVFVHCLLTAIQYVGINEQKPKIYMGIAIFCHFLNNLSAIS